MKTECRIIPLIDWNRYHIWPTVGGLRHLAQYRQTNGFAPAFMKVKNRILIKEGEFFRCVSRQQELDAVEAQRRYG